MEEKVLATLARFDSAVKAVNDTTTSSNTNYTAKSPSKDGSDQQGDAQQGGLEELEDIVQRIEDEAGVGSPRGSY